MRSPIRALRRTLVSGRFKFLGPDVWFDPNGTYTYESISVGAHSNLGLRPILMASRSAITIGAYVMFGPEVTIRGGNHCIDVLGKRMIEVTDQEKQASDDQGVVIEDDVWVGTRAIILHGVTIGRGSVIAAGAVASRSVAPYTIVGGVPAREIGRRFSIDEILQHEAAIYPPARRLSRAQLEEAWEGARRVKP